MNSMEFNKIAGATIGALLLFLLLNFFSGAIYGTREGGEGHAGGEHGPVLAYAVEIEDAGHGGGEQAPQVDLLALFQAPDTGAGEKIFRACGACHSVEAGVNKVGPSLHGVVGHDVAAVEGFAYSDAMAAVEGDWTPAHLFAFLENPKGVVPGTKMSYAGLKDPHDRADVIAYLNEAGGSPVDLTEGIEPLAPAAEEHGSAEVTGTEAAAGGTATDAASATESHAAAGAAAGTEQVGVTIVGAGDKDVEVESVVPLEISEGDKDGSGGVIGETAGATEPATSETATAGTAAETTGATAEPSAGEAATGDAATAEPDAPMVVAAVPGGDAAAGEKLFRRCMACHKLDEGKNGIGPTLHHVVGRDIASVEGYDYSDAMAAQEGDWTPERLAEYLADPKGAVPGNKMAFAGLKNQQDRADVITYLQQSAE